MGKAAPHNLSYLHCLPLDVERGAGRLEQTLNRNAIPRKFDIWVRSAENLTESDLVAFKRIRAIQSRIGGYQLNTICRLNLQ